MNPILQAVLAATASFFVVTLIFAVLFAICKERRKRRSGTRTSPQIRTPRNLELSSISIESTTFDPTLKFSMPEIAAATGNFNKKRIIGDGGFGSVFKAHLSDGVTVAVKKLSKDAFQGFREFRAEMETLSRVRHRNIVKILGYCVSGADRVLIYEFIEKGSLDSWLHESSSEESGSGSSSIFRLPLPWDTRVKIIKGVSDGLRYLHTLERPIIHRDIKASNILLDSDFEPHISDFGLARSVVGNSHVSTQVAGTMGYMPPEYKEGLTEATVRADVYSFGIVMIETATGKRPNWPVKVDGKEVGLVEWAQKMSVKENGCVKMVDESVAKDGLKEDQVKEFFRIASLCTKECAKERPPMRDVVDMLSRL